MTGRCLKVITFEEKVSGVEWSPSATEGPLVLAVTSGSCLYLLNSGVEERRVSEMTDTALLENAAETSTSESPLKSDVVQWEVVRDGALYDKGVRCVIRHKQEVSKVCWYRKSTYVATVVPSGGNQSVLLHNLQQKRSQCPFQKAKGLVQCVLFHPSKPYLFVATQRYVRIYNLTKQELTKKLLSNSKWISSMAIHPGGDNLIIGSYDCRLSWFDLDLSVRPYQTLRHHRKAIRNVCYHPKYPLFASASDDGTVIVCHGMVYNDYLQNALIVPVKRLRGHKTTDQLAAIDCTFHPRQPWIFSCGSDTTVRLYT